MTRYDVLIVGTRCAGAALAMLLARSGYRVLGFDRATFPSDTISTHFLWPRTTSFLNKWGLLDSLSATGCPPINVVTADYGTAAVIGRPTPVDGTDVMYSPRRKILDSLLVEAARSAGADIREAMTFRELIFENGRVVGARAQDQSGRYIEHRATIVVGADGLWSPVARAAGAATEIYQRSLTCGYYAYWDGLQTDGVEFYVRDKSDILVFPTHDGLTCIWAGRIHSDWNLYRSNVQATYNSIISLAPSLARRLESARQASQFKGTSKLPNFYRQSFGKGWALVGDAAYHRDPLTGMGIGDAFLGAELLAKAITAEPFGKAADFDAALGSYQADFRNKTMHVFEYTLNAARLKDPINTLSFYKKIASSALATTWFMDVLAGSLGLKEFLMRSNAASLLA
jgi:2-polyprenyl-6-methoxyphenol hydroxylase-like FAD-dependent oxidoreductase